MKGTIDAGLPNAAETILNDAKEKAEHATIVDLIRNDLSMVAENVSVKRYRYIDTLQTNKGDLLQVIINLPANVNISQAFDNGTLTLTGTASASYYKQALEDVTYSHNDGNMSSLARTITFQVNDGMICGFSNQFNHTIYINATATPTPTPPPRFNSSQLAMLIVFPIGGFLLTLFLGLYLYRRYQALHEFDDDGNLLSSKFE